MSTRGPRIDPSSRTHLGAVPVAAEPVLEQVFGELGESLSARKSRYVELTARSHFSFLRGASSPEALVRRAHALGYDTLALTDYGGLYGAVRAWQEAERLGLKLILGAELEGGLHGRAQPASRLTLLVQEARGYQSLCRLLSAAHAPRRSWSRAALQAGGNVWCEPEELALALEPADRSDWADPWLDWQALRTHHEGLLVLLHDPYPDLEFLQQRFGARLSLAVCFQRDGHDRARFARATDASRRTGVPIVAVGDVRFAERDDKEIYDVLQCVREGRTLQQAGRALLPNTELRLKSEQEVQRLYARHPEWIERSRALADRCDFSLRELKVQFPSESRGEQSADERLRGLTEQGLRARYGEAPPADVRAQVERELELIAEIQVAPYFLSVHEIVQIARERDILCQGRGSSANSAVCYCLGITAIDPVRSGLLFERFLSRERKEPPDIDVDFEHDRREEVIAAIYEKYGRERAAMVCSVIAYRGRSALRDVGKVLGFSEAQVQEVARRTGAWGELGEAEQCASSAQQLQEPGFLLWHALAKRLQGVPRHLSIHVGGFVLSAQPLAEVAPIEPASMPGRTILPWDKDDLDALGFFKLDVLALGMLSALQRSLRAVFGEDKPVSELLAALPAECEQVYDALCEADTVGVFQIESRAQMAMLPRLRPRCFYDVVVEVALVRPGPVHGGMVHPYLRRRTGQEAVDCPHPDLWPILQRTLGVPLFQEQVMQIAMVGAGYTGGQADQLRRDMAAWRRSGDLARHHESLRLGFAERGIGAAWAERLFRQIQGFAEYGFPESHAASFALLVYASAWLKVHHPAAFLLGLLNSQPMGFYSPATLIEDAKRHGVQVLPVCVQCSEWPAHLERAATTEGTRDTVKGPVRLGLSSIKGFGADAAARVVAARATGPFASIEELARRAQLSRRELGLLAEGSALHAFGGTRRTALYRSRAPREGGLLREMALDAHEPELPPERPAEQLLLDYERLGLSLGAHPLALLRPQLAARAVRSDALREHPPGPVRTAGLVICRQRPATASGVTFLTLEDEVGFVNLVVWAGEYPRLAEVLEQSSLLMVEGTLQQAQGTSHVMVERAWPLRVPDGVRGAVELPSQSRDFH